MFVWSNHGEKGNVGEDQEIGAEEKPRGENIFHPHSPIHMWT